MKSVIDEEWEAVPMSNACEYTSFIRLVGPIKPGFTDTTLFYANDDGRSGAMEPRLRLAAQAPAMARLLVDWSNKHGQHAHWPCDERCTDENCHAHHARTILKLAGVLE